MQGRTGRSVGGAHVASTKLFFMLIVPVVDADFLSLAKA